MIYKRSCPVDSFVFPELDKLRTEDSLEARFNAFKIPESNFLVFEATVRSCREGCQPVSTVLSTNCICSVLICPLRIQAYCPGQLGRVEPSYGRRKRSLNDTGTEQSVKEADISNSTAFADNEVINATGKIL